MPTLAYTLSHVTMESKRVNFFLINLYSDILIITGLMGYLINTR